MENYVIEVGITVIVSPSQVGNCKIADTRENGPIARPRRIVVVPSCRRRAQARSCSACCLNVAEDREVGDATNLADGSVIDLIASRV
jgi:hypothetical protein